MAARGGSQGRREYGGRFKYRTRVCVCGGAHIANIACVCGGGGGGERRRAQGIPSPCMYLCVYVYKSCECRYAVRRPESISPPDTRFLIFRLYVIFTVSDEGVFFRFVFIHFSRAVFSIVDTKTSYSNSR